MVGENGQAGTEIEITPEMIPIEMVGAGVEASFQSILDEDPREIWVAEIIAAALASAPPQISEALLQIHTSPE